ncbi:hypothetical protein VCV18_012706 [Metarhizium anisopliae]
MAEFGLVQQVHLQFVPHCVYHGALKSLHIYIWDRIPGRLSVGFFASAWVNSLPNLEPPPPGLQDKYVGILNELSLSLPDSLHSTIDMVRQNLYLLFRPKFPIALQHGGILKNNIHIEEETGHITSIVG